MKGIERILVPVDFEEPSRAGLELALSLGERLGARIDLVHVVKIPSYFSPVTEVVTAAGNRPLGPWLMEQRTQECARFLGRSGLDPAAFKPLVVFGDPVDEILALAERYDLIVMGTHGRTGVSRIVLGSVAEQVLRRAPCPVTIVHPPATAAETAHTPEARPDVH